MTDIYLGWLRFWESLQRPSAEVFGFLLAWAAFTGLRDLLFYLWSRR